ncbi:Tetratricopeptide repeat-containing protein [Mariniphaga anaerophila]|uniref:histidine kinase n=1 Tax=Mariniphaga anaerophila TaxID=1484053 RepID=A0A1M5AJV8_9BACT|nr:tetratricopeptide repeat protein [Mariniphaga anaerophila]SHF30503.1 Tetratricopeptide repeat-containing protein [Mariniphaga anaerophila]
MKLAYLLILLIVVNLQAASQHGITDNKTQTQVSRIIETGEKFINSSPDSALFYAEKSEKIARTKNYSKGVVASLLLKGKALNEKKEYEDALVTLKQSQQLVDIQDSITSGKICFEQGTSFYRIGKTDSSLHYLTRALALFDSQAEKIDIAHAQRILALSYWSKGLYAEGLTHIQKAINLYTELNDTYYLSITYNTKGAILWGLASYEKALELFFEALYLNEKTGQSPGLKILLLNNIGLVYHDWEDDINALKYFRKAEGMIPESSSKVGIAYTYLNLGTLHLNKGETKIALETLNKAMNGYASANDINGVCLSKTRIGECYTLDKEFQKAEKSLHEAIELSQRSANKHREASAWFQLSKNDIAREAMSDALDNSLKCLEIATNGQYKDIMQNVLTQLSTLYKQNGNTGRSLEMLQKATEIKDEIYKEKIAVQYDIMELAYENQLKEHENSRLKSENLLKQRSLHFMYAAVLLILMAFFAISFFFLKLRKKKKELQEANHAKDKIFSIVSHDLRGPVGTLNSMVDILVEEDHGFDYRELLNQYKPIIAGSFNMLENLLVWAKSNLGKLESTPVSLSLNKTIEETISLFSHFALEKSIAVTFEPHKKTIVLADKILLETVVRNLLKNAIKFTRKNGNILIKTKEQENFAIISVIDDGVGIPEKVQQSVLKGFYHSEGTQNEKGSGLGLTLSNELAEKNGGKLWFTSIEEKGSTFSFSVPLDTNSRN